MKLTPDDNWAIESGLSETKNWLIIVGSQPPKTPWKYQKKNLQWLKFLFLLLLMNLFKKLKGNLPFPQTLKQIAKDTLKIYNSLLQWLKFLFLSLMMNLKGNSPGQFTKNLQKFHLIIRLALILYFVFNYRVFRGCRKNFKETFWCFWD